MAIASLGLRLSVGKPHQLTFEASVVTAEFVPFVVLHQLTIVVPVL